MDLILSDKSISMVGNLAGHATNMTHQRVSIIFWNETITVDGIEKRIPLRLPHLLRLKRLDWYGDACAGLLLFNDKRELQFSDPAIVTPFIERWQSEPAQPDIAQLKRYVDEITIDPSDTYDSTPRRRWAEIEKRHSQPIYAAALLQLLSTQYALDADHTLDRGARNISPVDKTSRLAAGARGDSIVRYLLNKTGNAQGQVQRSPIAKMIKINSGDSALKKREAERRRMQNNAKSR